ncbi:MAG: YraN family protein [Coriobacteriales bacterium]|nr:YraN family protein [Coriobacteriales bacterium]
MDGPNDALRKSCEANENDVQESVVEERYDADGKHNQELGAKGEEAARYYLERRGCEILEQNWQCPFGEADLIAMDDGVLVFVEVKTRSCDAHGLPEEAVDAKKRRRYEMIALAYLKESDFDSLQVRFDVISITMMGLRKAFLRHHINAFGVGE